MTSFELLTRLREFYSDTLTKGWCQIEVSTTAVLTTRNSDVNFMHHPCVFNNFRQKSYITPKLSKANIKKLDILISSFDSTRLITVTPTFYGYKSIIYDSWGNKILCKRLRRSTIEWGPYVKFK